MSQIKWVFIMIMIVIIALGGLVVLLLYDKDNGSGVLPAPAATATLAGTAGEATESPKQPQADTTPPAAAYVFQIYDDGPVHYGDIAYMGSINNGDDGSMLIDSNCAENPHSGSSCIRIAYDPPSPGHWAGMMWLSGANNFPPNLPVDGADLAQAKKLAFYVRGSGATKFFIENEKKQQVTKNVQLTQAWTQHTLDIPSDWEHICVGFGFASSGAAGESTIYLDDIAFSD